MSGSGAMISLPERVGGTVSDMHTGTLRLSVPLLDDAIQVGAEGTLAIGTIEVDKTPATMSVRRSDGRPLQAHILHRCADGHSSRNPVFQEPIALLLLRYVRQADGSRVWAVAPGARIRKHRDLVQLVVTIMAFGLAKQDVRSGRAVARRASTDPLPSPAVGAPTPARHPPE
jgi:hypothetical protein